MKAAWRFVLLLVGLASTASHAIDAAALFRKAAPSVVMVMAFDAAGQPKSIGSGVYVGNGNTIATNLHVVAGATTVKIKSNAGVADIKFVVGVDEKRDLAILTTDLVGPTLMLSERVPDIGEEVVAVGNPKGLEGTVSTGIVSGVREYEDSVIFQVTTPISPGSSGGPVVDTRGQVLALTTFLP